MKTMPLVYNFYSVFLHADTTRYIYTPDDFNHVTFMMPHNASNSSGILFITSTISSLKIALIKS